MPIVLSSSILKSRFAVPAAVPEDDEGGVIIQGEENPQINPFISDKSPWKTVLKYFGDRDQWELPRDELDRRYSCFMLEPPNMTRPRWFRGFMDYAAKKRYEFKNPQIGSDWKHSQSLLKLLVIRFFELSKSPLTNRSLFRASIVLGLVLIAHRDSSKTSMVLHLARSVMPPEPPEEAPRTLHPNPSRASRRASAPIGLSHPATKSGAATKSRPATKRDARKIVKNLESVYTMMVHISEEIARLNQNRKGTRANPIGDEKKIVGPGIEQLSDNSESEFTSESEDGVEDEVEDQVEHEGGEGLHDDEEDEVQHGDHDESGHQDDDEEEEEEEGHSEDEEYSRGRKRQRLQPSSSSL